ncbi:CRISPR-associated protein, TIGR02710 family [Thermodesulfobium narugense DSM 14796]|uniref:CRISPR-associated protein, TIGR02710 family n=1 Tax=Thermodesulfobium narugense DSM 14796 TaxID=747365 RepID=M1E7P7_9BACT|nr:TIGR02710 family CRISPR-associated CARF protein [Thermodesulfobium narugense]AEE15341.1 CRISPR-associated protein, TIGR02710 family [Thermodesulfobium narugense DSM 14796]
MRKAKAMIITLGGTPEPVIKSIKSHKPKYVSIIASQDSINQIIFITQETKNSTAKIKKFIVDDHQSIEETFCKANEAYDWISEFATPEEIVVDFTPGTKAMSVGLFMAMSNKRVRFCYIGGKKRTKEGIGVVESGYEEIIEIKNPLETFQKEKINQFVDFFNSQFFAAADRILVEIIEKTAKKTLFKAIREINRGYYLWDIFHYKEAIRCFRPAVMERISEEKKFKDFYNAIESNRKFLEVISVSTNKFKDYSLELFSDVYENAQRRALAGHFDDAVLRLYRLIEMIAQERLKTKFGQDSSSVDFDKLKISEDSKSKWKELYKGKKGLGLNAVYDLLYNLNDELGITFQLCKESFKKVQDSRNLSFLAHGITPLDEKIFNEIDSFIKEVFISELKIGLIDERASFPKIDKNIFTDI